MATEGCGANCAKAILIFFNIIFWLSGCALLAIGLWMRFDPDIKERLSFLNVATDTVSGNMLDYASYVIIAVGAFVFIVGFFGCCGAIKENKCLLGLYIFCLIIVMLVEIAAAALGIYFKEKIMDEIDTSYKVQVTANWDVDSKESFREAINFVQMQGKCCGWKDQTDYDGLTPILMVPSCCLLTDTAEVTAVTISWNDTSIFTDVTGCKAATGGFYTDSCKQKMQDWIQSHAFIIIGVGIGIACLELFGIIFACCLCRNIMS